MGLRRITAEAAIARLGEFSAILDARSEAEFAEDRLPGARNWPSLTNEERRIVGTEYVQGSPFQARKIGAAMVARNIAGHIEREVLLLDRDWRPLVYCWRGGQRSAALATVLDQIGFHVHVLEGGYREFRRAVIADLERLPPLALRVLTGSTGSGKSRLLQALRAAGGQVLDLEDLAAHRGSVLGPLPDRAQPSQKGFETRLWQSLRTLDAARPVFIEAESRMIGRLRVPESLLHRLRVAPCIRVTMPLPARVALLVEDYAHLVRDPQALCDRLQALRELRGAAVVERWQAHARAGRTETLVQELLAEHYDPIYRRSTERNFEGQAKALEVALDDGSPGSLAAAAHALLAREGALPHVGAEAGA